jgi:hypothetical protein
MASFNGDASIWDVSSAKDIHLMRWALHFPIKTYLHGTYQNNLGGIFLIKNQQIGQRTKQIDIRKQFIRELHEGKEVEPRFVRSEDNYSDGNTKNQPETLFNEHATLLKNGNMKCLREDVKGVTSSRKDDVIKGLSESQE